MDNKYIFCLYPTAIFTKIIDLKRSFAAIKKQNAHLLCPTVKNPFPLRSFIARGKRIQYILPKFRKFRSQDLPDVLSDSGSFYIFNRKALLKLNQNKLMPHKSIFYLLNNKFTIDINTPEDLKKAKSLYKKLKKIN